MKFDENFVFPVYIHKDVMETIKELCNKSESEIFGYLVGSILIWKGIVYIIIEDLISTGGSSARAVQAVRNANGECNYCFSIFSYGLKKASELFGSLEPPCEIRSLLTYDVLLEAAKETGYLTEKQVKVLEEWGYGPFEWGEKHGFPKIEK